MLFADKKITLTAVAAAVLFAGAAQAADIQIYGRVDAGVRYTHTHGQGDDSDKIEMRHNRSTSRVGFNIVEQINPDLKAKVYLETGFASDTGAFDNKDNQLFQRRSILALEGKWGEFGAGRFGTVQSTMGPYSMGLLKWDPYATSYLQASIGSTFANTGRVNNGLNWISPKLAGWRLGATYSLGDASDENNADNDYGDDYSDRDHTLALAADYQGENFYFSAAMSNVEYGNKENASRTDDAQTFGIGGWYAVMPKTKIWAAAQYQRHWEKAGKVKLSSIGATDIGTGKTAGGVDGYSLLLGLTHETGNHKFLTNIQHFNGELSDASDVDYNFTVLSAAWEYKLAPKVWYYIAATHSMDGGSVANVKYSESDGVHQSATEFMTGVQINF